MTSFRRRLDSGTLLGADAKCKKKRRLVGAVSWFAVGWKDKDSDQGAAGANRSLITLTLLSQA